MHENLFKHINIPQQNIYIPSGTTDNYAAFCQWYEQRIKECGGIDLQILGIGSDGHIAFNEPVQLARLAHAHQDPGPADDRRQRPLLRHAARTCRSTRSRWAWARSSKPARSCCWPTAENKADAVAPTVEGPVTSMITASALQLHPAATVFLDDAAASELKMRDYYDWVKKKKPDAPPA